VRQVPFMLLVLALGCEGVLPEPDLERMIDQRSLRAYERTSLFSDGRAMRPPPPGTIARDVKLGAEAANTGVTPAGDYVDQLPFPLTRPLLERGRNRFEIYCAPCHGVRGGGATVVAANMTLRRPPSLVGPPVTEFPVGRIFQVASAGYGLMPSYQSQLTVRDRWAVVAYLRALALSQRVSLARLPPPERAQAERALP
jgi:mono/diheme cytochrome c family protein